MMCGKLEAVDCLDTRPDMQHSPAVTWFQDKWQGRVCRTGMFRFDMSGILRIVAKVALFSRRRCWKLSSFCPRRIAKDAHLKIIKHLREQRRTLKNYKELVSWKIWKQQDFPCSVFYFHVDDGNGSKFQSYKRGPCVMFGKDTFFFPAKWNILSLEDPVAPPHMMLAARLLNSAKDLRRLVRRHCVVPRSAKLRHWNAIGCTAIMMKSASNYTKLQLILMLIDNGSIAIWSFALPSIMGITKSQDGNPYLYHSLLPIHVEASFRAR